MRVFCLTGRSETRPERKAEQDSCKGQLGQFGEEGVHWMAPKSIMAWLYSEEGGRRKEEGDMSIGRRDGARAVKVF